MTYFRWKTSLVFKQSFSIILLFVAIFSVLLLVAYTGISGYLAANTASIAEDVTHNVASELDRIFFDIERTVKQLVIQAENPSSTAEELQLQMTRTLKLLYADNIPAYAICIAFSENYSRRGEPWRLWYVSNGPNGETEFVSNDNPAEYIQEKGFMLPKSLHEPVWTEPYFDVTLGNRMMATYSAPLFENDPQGNRQFVGIVSLDITLEEITQLVKEIPQKPELRSVITEANAFLLSRNGRFLTHPQEEYILNETIYSIPPQGTDVEQYRQNIRSILSSVTNTAANARLYQSPLDESCSLSFAQLKSNHWTIGLTFPQKTLYHRIYSMQMYMLGFSIFGTLLVLALVILITKRGLAPLEKLCHTAQKIGAGDLTAEVPEVPGSDEIATLTRSFREMKSELTNYIEELRINTIAREKIESELAVAHTIQKWLLPELQSPFSKQGEFSLFAELFAAKAVGGDLFDFFFITDRKLCFAIGDVSGKGVPAALFMAVVQTLHRGLASPDLDCGEIMTKINTELAKNNELMMFVSCFLAVLDLDNGVLEFCNAGHNRPLLRHADTRQSDWISELHGPPLAISDHTYRCGSLTMKPGDEIFLYTDGVTEAHNAHLELYGEQRLQALLSNPETKFAPDALLERVLAEVNRFAAGTEQFDDITIMAVQYCPIPLIGEKK